MLQIFIPNKNRSSIIFGKRGSGKTILIESLILSHISLFSRIVFLMCTDDPDDYKLLRHRNDEKCSISFLKMDAEKLCELRQETQHFIKNYPEFNGRLLLVLDDPLGSNFDTKQLQAQIAEILYNGRHYINFIMSSQSVTRISSDLRSNFDNVFVKYFKSTQSLKNIYRTFIDGDESKLFIKKCKEMWKNNKYSSLFIDHDDELYIINHDLPIEGKKKTMKISFIMSKF